MATLQDFSLLQTYVHKHQKDYSFETPSKAFVYLCLDLILNLQDDEIEESITDGGMDRGIDAIYIDTSESIAHIHIFNFKYSSKFEKIKSYFPSNEIDKVISIVKQILDQDKNLKKQTNPDLYEKIKYIWGIFKDQNPKFTIYFCSNLENNFMPIEQQRLENELSKHTHFQIQYCNIHDFSKLLTSRGRKK